TSSDQLVDNLYDVMMETLPSLVKQKVTKQVKKEVPMQVRDQVLVYLADGLILEWKMTKEETERLISKAILQERGRPTSGIRATKGTLHKIEQRSKSFIPPNQVVMSANDNFSLHDDEELSLHDDASLDGSVPASNKGDAPAKPPQIITTNTLS
ncbi:hypothetical protein Tco_0063155, partial [Tanacetum coccineum]